jgi:outer membrane protein insertion porin family/translocation and assembly module TamA
MRARWIVGAVIAVLVGSPVLGVTATVDDLTPGGTYRVRAIRFEGTKELSASTLRDAMLTKVPPWYQPWKRWRQRVPFNPQLFLSDLDRVRTALRESGHFVGTVGYDLEIDKDELTIVIQVEEGPAAKVESVDVVTTDFTPTDAEHRALEGALRLHVDDVLTQTEYDASRAALDRYLQQAGYAYVRVDKAAIVDTATDRARVTFTITRGPAAVFGETVVIGTSAVAPRLITREVQWHSGDPWDPREVEKAQANVFGLHLFRSVAVKPSNLEAQSGVVDMAITVSEGPPREIKVGIGYGVEDELRGQIRWQNYDFFGGGRQLGFSVKASFIQQQVAAEFRQPYFLSPQQTFVAPLTQEREEEPGFTVARIRFAPRIERRLLPDLRVAIGYNIEYDDTSNVPDETKASLEEFKPRGFVSSITGLLERNTANDLLDPHEGSVMTLAGEQAGGPWGGDFSFYKVTFEAKKYVPVFGTRVLAGRVRIGGGDAFGQSQDIPIFRRFFAGGINSTRGYGRYKIGPLTDGGDPIGGRSLLEGNFEFRTPVYKKIGGVAFVDVGEVRESPFSYNLDDLQFGVGLGVRYQTPIGPLRLDFGIPLEPRGQQPWQVHFSIGQAF